MDIVVNDYSLQGQFSNPEEFIESLIDSTIPILDLIKEKKYYLWKKSNFYSSPICYKETLYTILRHMPSHPAIQKIKMNLIELTRNEPFWDVNSISPTIGDSSDFQCEYSHEYPSCFSEVYHRNAMLLSFVHPNFTIEEVPISIHGSTHIILNACNLHSFSEHLATFGEPVTPQQRNSFIICNDCQFEIRFSENNHSLPHFHVKKGDFAISINIADLSTLSGSLPLSTKRMVLEWARSNINKIKSLWNSYHPDKMI